MSDSQELSRRRGPRRASGEPVGPQQVRRAVLDAGATLFSEHGVDRVSIRDVAAAANVHPTLIGRYIGTRAELIVAVFDDLSEQLAASVLDNPLDGQGFTADAVSVKWARIAGALTITGVPLAGRGAFNPVLAMAETLAEGYGLDPRAARVRAAQIVATALGWRIFEPYLIQAGELEDVEVEELRDEVVRSARRLGATPWPSPPDPPPQPR